jgi:hypothetical protein
MKLTKNMMRKSLPLLTLCLGATACNLTEDISDCPADMRLSFSFSRYGTSFITDEVSSLSVFVFDANNRFVGRWDEMDSAMITDGYTMTLSLSRGTYRFVAWGGLDDDNYYLSSPGKGLGHLLNPVKGQTSFDDFAVRIARDTREHRAVTLDFVDVVPGGLFFGDTEPIALEANVDREVDIPLVKYSNTINLTVTGLPAPGNTRAAFFPHVGVNLYSPNGSYAFDGRIASDRARLTWPQHDSDRGPAEALTSTIYTLRPVFGNEHTLEIYAVDSGKIIYSADLLDDLIRKTQDETGRFIYNTQEAVDTEDTYDIVIDLTGVGFPDSNVGVRITINDYVVQTTENIIQ